MKKGFRILKFKKDKPVFEVKDISKSFDGRPILKKLSLKVFPGEIVGLLGPNGAGKSTLFNIAIGAETADDGEIFISGKPINQIPIHLRSKLGLGYLPQTRSLFDTLSTFDNIFGLVQLHEPNNKKALEILNSKPNGYVPLYDELKGDIYVAKGEVEKARIAYESALKNSNTDNVSPFLRLKLEDLGQAPCAQGNGCNTTCPGNDVCNG